jgi:hypothetical protein
MPVRTAPVLPTRLKAITATTYTLTAFDQEGVVTAANAGAITITIPASTSVNYPIGTQIKIIQTGAGAVTLAAPSDGAIVPATSNTAAAGDTLILTKTTATGWHCGTAVAS